MTDLPGRVKQQQRERATLEREYLQLRTRHDHLVFDHVESGRKVWPVEARKINARLQAIEKQLGGRPGPLSHSNVYHVAAPGSQPPRGRR